MLQCIIPLKPIPIGEHYSDQKLTEAQRYPIDIYQCIDCHCVQTNDDISPDYLWKDYTYFSGRTPRIIKHFAEFVEQIQRDFSFCSNPDTALKVLDIGSNDGALLEEFNIAGFEVLGIDPSSTVAAVAHQKGIPTIVSLFNEDAARKHIPNVKFDIITAFNVFAHSSDMPSMIRAVKSALSPEGLFFFEVQYLGDIAEKKILGTIFHEHMIHYSITSARSFLSRFGLKLIDFYRNNIQNGSIIFVAANEGSSIAANRFNLSKIDDACASEVQQGLLTDQWTDGIKEYIHDTRVNVKNHFGNKTLSAYGAARSGPTLAIQFGFDGTIDMLYDDHPSKIGKFSPFNTLEVVPTKLLNPNKSPNCIILAYIHYKAIIANHVEYLMQGGRFILLWPHFSIIDKNNYSKFLA